MKYLLIGPIIFCSNWCNGCKQLDPGLNSRIRFDIFHRFIIFNFILSSSPLVILHLKKVRSAQKKITYFLFYYLKNKLILSLFRQHRKLKIKLQNYKVLWYPVEDDHIIPLTLKKSSHFTPLLLFPAAIGALLLQYTCEKV